MRYITYMPTVKIRIEMTSSDPYWRYVGMTIDKPLRPDFWVSQPGAVIGVAKNGHFDATLEREVSIGRHVIYVGTSGIHRWPWRTRVYVNGKLVASGLTWRGHPVKGTFTVGVPLPGGKLTLILVPVAVGVGGYIAYRLLRRR